MNNLHKIAILNSYDSDLGFELDEFTAFCQSNGIAVSVFEESESILAFKPDCVLVTTPQDAKLTPYPTYGLINRHSNSYLELPRLLRNILTYDGYLCFSPKLKQLLGDLMFGVRKLGSLICPLEFFPRALPFQEPIIDAKKPTMAVFVPDFANSKYKQAIKNLLTKYSQLTIVIYKNKDGITKFEKRVEVANDANELTSILHKHGIVICLDSGLNDDRTINTCFLKAIASSTVVIAHQTNLAQQYFGDSLYYLSAETKLEGLSKAIEFHIKQIYKSPKQAIAKCKQAYQIFCDNFSLNTCFNQFIHFHQQTLINKGYLPNPNLEIEQAMPSVTYIMRTGGKHRHFLERALDCLLAQQYPDLRVIFVIHAKFSYLDEIIAKYPSLRIKVLERIKSKRSEAIRDGMAAVETELFGLFDDDDELFPNHVRMLVKTFQYHNKRDWRGEIGMVYSGSIHADDTHPVLERGEFRDHTWLNKNEKRAIEHFRLYSSALMSQHSWFMPNGWLAQSKFIDNELLDDPQIDTCEDLYFELQIAQRGHFAFSVEVTAIHYFHYLGNSTIEDSHLHIPDTQRIALRNFSRVFPMDSQYDTELNLIGKPVSVNPNVVAYQDKSVIEVCTSWFHNPYFPFRYKPVNIQQTTNFKSPTHGISLTLLPKLALKIIPYSIKFITLDNTRKKLYLKKALDYKNKYGYPATFRKVIDFARTKYMGDPANHYNKKHYSRAYGKLRRLKQFLLAFVSFKCY